MLNTEQLKANRMLVNQVDWTMTPEKAIDMYLEWGSGWTRGHDFVSHHGQEAIYFVLYDWEGPQATLIRRNMAGAEEIAQVAVPRDLFEEACREDGYRPGVGVHALNEAMKEWLCTAIDGTPLEYLLAGNM